MINQVFGYLVASSNAVVSKLMPFPPKKAIPTWFSPIFILF